MDNKQIGLLLVIKVGYLSSLGTGQIIISLLDSGLKNFFSLWDRNDTRGFGVYSIPFECGSTGKTKRYINI